MFLIRLVLFPFKVAFKTSGFAMKTGYRSGRVIGYRRMFFFGTGVAVGLLIAPTPGRELRAKLSDLLAKLAGPEPDLSEKVRVELSRSPRTWHLPQPDVTVEGTAVVLSGTVPHASAKADIEQTAGSVPGVSTVRSLLSVAGTNGHN